MKYLIALLCVLPLINLAPAPPAHAVYWTRIAVQTSAPLQQECTFDTAPPSARLSAAIVDPIGYPFGMVQAWSCTGDTVAVANELAARASAMQAEAATYRAAHPVKGATP